VYIILNQRARSTQTSEQSEYMKSPCVHHKCIQCCLETEMPLSKKDLEQIKRLGLDYDYFVVNKDGWLQLKNYNGRCVFNDDNQCSIYENRPEGCKLYPIIYDENENCPILDEDCPHRDEFKISKINVVILRSIVTRLKDEREIERNL
jgi:Fe-S-cluster containining protein